ncbi:T9SS type A sorting domain-containing protein [Dyadobacter sp. BHUBP1]|uniref:T9SS type A sorting domain-containing protein n=1 Tax=Dyadobacter sp. BHUBP1 TaxID=3424178 RepID=UPI003D34C123
MKKMAFERAIHVKILAILVLQILCLPCRGQFKVEAGAIVKTASGARINLYNMDMVVNGIVDQVPGAGTYIFSGNDNNTFKGTSIPTLDKVILSKPAGSKVVMNQNLLIGSLLNFVSGSLDLNNSLLQVKPSGLITGESDAGGIVSSGNGYVYTTTSLNAPASANPGNLGAVISSAANLGVTTVRRRHVPQAVSPANTGISRYYEIYPSNNTGLDATLRFYYSDSELNGLSENVLTLWRNGGSWEDLGYTSRDTAENYVEKRGISAFSTWTLAKSSNPLPVSLASFQIVKTGSEGISLRWETTFESHTREFLVERSMSPANGFALIGRVASANNQSGAAYDYTDLTAGPGQKYYYRLKMVDTDDTFAFSRIISAEISGSPRFTIYPNPATSTARLFNQEGISSLGVLNAAGNRVAHFTYTTLTTATTLHLETLPSGAYFLQVTDRRGLQKIIKLVVAH